MQYDLHVIESTSFSYYSCFLARSEPSLGGGCPSNSEYKKTELMTSTSQKAGVACCNMAGDECVRPDDCLTVTFEKAEEKCVSIGMRLCTVLEQASGLCCGLGCGLDYELAWQVGTGK